MNILPAGKMDCADITVGGDYEYQGAGVLLHNSADCLFAIYQDAPLRQKREATITWLKARDAQIPEPFNIYMPAEHRLVAELETLDDSQMSSLLEA
jgi:hypothetical protein